MVWWWLCCCWWWIWCQGVYYDGVYLVCFVVGGVFGVVQCWFGFGFVVGGCCGMDIVECGVCFGSLRVYCGVGSGIGWGVGGFEC